ncbi:MAG: IS1182 family transposase [Chloroflexota bacterium]|nr:IS1182 family transposase [Chloroflexota bacterium]
MLGPPKSRRLDEPIAVSLDDLVPADHFYRHLEAKLDLGFVREWVRELYADRGRPSVDPVVFFKLQLVMFFEGIRSERKLVETASLNLAHRWYLGYALDEELPDHSSLTRIRRRLGVAIFERFFERVVDLCQEAGLVWGKELFFDATKVRADAAVASLVPRFSHEARAHVAGLSADSSGAPPADADPSPSDGLRRLPIQEFATERPWKLMEERRLDPNRPASGSYRRTSDWRVSTTDPDATPMRVGGGTSLGYHDRYVVDGGKARVILAALVTPADVMENAPMRDLLWRVRFRRKLRPRQVTGDTTYGTIENIVVIEAAGIRAYVPLPDFDRRTPGFGKHAFAYDPDLDAYRCPGDALLRPLKHEGSQPVRIYQAPAAACNVCPLQPSCTTSRRGRRVARHVDEGYLDRVRAYHETEAYRKAMRKRQVWVEPLFAEAKDWHGLRRFRLRGLANVNVEGLLVAAGQNLKRLLAATGWGRRHAPCGSLVALPRGLQQLMATPH